MDQLFTIITEFEAWTFLAGLGIFLFGMHMMEESIRILSGAAFKELLRRYTATRLKSIFSGIVSTAVLQSSSAVSLLVLAFTGAGIMNLIQAVSVMMGAKIGTTATAWIVAVFGFKVNIDSFSLPLIGIGGLGIILLAKSPRYVNISRFLVAFGFLFMGLDYMKTSVGEISEMIDPEILADYGIIVFALVGMVLTAIMQSSSATIAIVLTMLFSGVIGFSSGAAMVVGANVGTTVTVLLGAIGGIQIKKQAALAQLIFTTTIAVFTLLILPLIVWFVLTVLGFSDNIVLGLAMFHTLFNVAGVSIFYPLTPKLVQSVERWLPESMVDLTHYIHKTDPEIVDAGLEAFRKEIGSQLEQTLIFADQTIRNLHQRGTSMYVDLERYHAEIFGYYARLHSFATSEENTSALDELLRASRNLMNAAKHIYDSQAGMAELKTESDPLSRDMQRLIEERVKEVAMAGKSVLRQTGERFLELKRSELDRLTEFVAKSDRNFIRICGEGMGQPGFKKVQATQWLMFNRLITQACRMIIFSMATILKYEALKHSWESPVKDGTNSLV